MRTAAQRMICAGWLAACMVCVAGVAGVLAVTAPAVRAAEPA